MIRATNLSFWRNLFIPFSLWIFICLYHPPPPPPRSNVCLGSFWLIGYPLPSFASLIIFMTDPCLEVEHMCLTSFARRISVLTLCSNFFFRVKYVKNYHLFFLRVCVFAVFVGAFEKWICLIVEFVWFYWITLWQIFNDDSSYFFHSEKLN